MGYIFRLIQRLGPAGVVLKAIVVALIGDGLLLGFILMRRTYRKAYFAKRDARVVQFQKLWSDILSGTVPYAAWRNKPFDRRIIESLALDVLEASPPPEAARTLKFLRESGLIQKRIFEAEKLRGWRRRRALVALGRTRAPEGVPALSDALRDGSLETRLAALRGLGRTCVPKAAEEILRWVGEVGLTVPALPLENALINCSRECPRLLLSYMAGASKPVREILARVLGETATAALDTDIIEMAGDPSAELRASAARALAHAKPRIAIPILAKMVEDPSWVVRLRAAVALGQTGTQLAVPALLQALTDSHRLVRLRAAQAIVELDGDPVGTFQRVVEMQDPYAQDALITAAENAGAYIDLVRAIELSPTLDDAQRQELSRAAAFRLKEGKRRMAAPPQDAVPQ
jgi:HEAT repeat protein